MKYPLTNQVLNRTLRLLKQIKQETDPAKEAYLLIQLNILLQTIQNNYSFPKPFGETILRLQKISVTLLTHYFKCTPDLLKEYIMSTIGKEPSPQNRANDKTSTTIIQMTSEEANYFKTAIHDGRLFYLQPDPTNSNALDNEIQADLPKKREFVLSHSGDLYVYDRTRTIEKWPEHQSYKRTVKHSSFLAGAEVIAAGEITIKNNKIVEISNRSGHYEPSHKDMALLVNHLQGFGVNLSKVNLKLTNPDLNIRADLFLTHYPELQKAQNTSFDEYKNENLKKNRKQEALSRQRNSPELQKLFEQYEITKKKIVTSARDNYVPKKDDESICEKNTNILNETSKQLTELVFEMWMQNYKTNLQHLDSIGFLLKIKGDQYFDPDCFNEKLLKHNLDPLPIFLNVDAKNSIPGEIVSANPAKLKGDQLTNQLTALKDYIENHKWQTFFQSHFSSFACFFPGPNYPTNVEKILQEINNCLKGTADPLTTYESVLKIARKASLNPSCGRMDDTKEFYEKIADNQLLELVGKERFVIGDLVSFASGKKIHMYQYFQLFKKFHLAKDKLS